MLGSGGGLLIFSWADLGPFPPDVLSPPGCVPQPYGTEHFRMGRGLLSAFGDVRMSKGHRSCVFRAESYDLAQMLLQSLPSEARPSQAWGKPENTGAGRLRQGRLPLMPHASRTRLAGRDSF